MTTIDWAELKVHDLARQQNFYQKLFDLPVTAQEPGRVELGGLLRLHADPHAQVPRQAQPGLFHLAFLLPDAQKLGGWLKAHPSALEGASDHGVSQALYLSDPEGNGIEVYADRPREEWPPEMYTRRLDLDRLLAGAAAWKEPDELRLGHIHLRSLSSRDGREWFARLGMQLTTSYPGAEFYAADGYHHHFAVNQWGVQAASLGRWTGLTGYGLSGAYDGGELTDPWGHRVELRSAS